MTPDYASILKTERLRTGSASSLSAEGEADRGRIVFSPAFRRLQQQGQLFSLTSSTAVRSRLSHALQVSQVGRTIAARVAAGLAAQGRADGETYAALPAFVETACLARDVGSPPYGEAGAAAIRNWFAEEGPGLIRAASLAYGARELEARDPRVLNALTDFHQFNDVPQGLRLLGKWHWHGEPGGLNLTKTSLATYLRHLDMCGGDSIAAGKAGEHAGFFSTEAGLVKGIWSAFGIDAGAPRRFPLTLLVEAAHEIVAGFGDLEDAIAIGAVDAGAALKTLRDEWLSTYIPMDPDDADEKIMELLGQAADVGSAAAFASVRAELFSVMADYAARCFLGLQEDVFAGKLDSVLPPTSGTAVLLQTLRNFCAAHIRTLEQVQRHALDGYNIVKDLLQQFAILLRVSMPRFQAAMASSNNDPSLFLEQQLLALIPSECRLAYSQAVAHLGGRDHEFEEWNVRAHLVVDFIAGQSDNSALTIYRRLAAIDL
ncbi:MAG TPA: dNTP triphosphohydrolase [Burkholderiaceae bacterium]